MARTSGAIDEGVEDSAELVLRLFAFAERGYLVKNAFDRT